jgi:hypothetical protein
MRQATAISHAQQIGVLDEDVRDITESVLNAKAVSAT